ncbi:hypothetical protein SDJN03_05944, partial [Cucurbita argyrosperma subsp. sororia]
MCAEIIEEFQKCHLDHPIGKFLGECTDLKIKLDRCFRQEKALKRKANFEQTIIVTRRMRKICPLHTISQESSEATEKMIDKDSNV